MEAMSLLGILGLCSLRDVKYKSLQTGILLLCASIGIWLHLYFARLPLMDMIGGMAVGVVLYLCAHFSGEKIGKGDALLVMVCGIFLGLWETLLLLWLSLLLASIFGICVMKLKGRGRGVEMPFVPFLLLGYVLCLCAWGGRIG